MTTGTATQAVVSGPVNEAVKRLNSEVTRCGDVQAQLESILHPVLMDTPPAAGAEKTPPDSPFTCELEGQLLNILHTVVSVTDRYQALTERCQL